MVVQIKIRNGVTSFKSLMTVLAATLGVGNIVGVAAAIAIGGIGSVFWIFVSGVFAIATKYVETYVVLKYRKQDKQGYYGGAMYVLRDRLGCKNLAILFSVFVIIASFGGNMIQSNAMAESIIETFHVNPYFLATVVTILSFYVIFGNEKRTANISSILVPVATILYMGMCCYLLYLFRDNLWASVVAITKEALSFKAGIGGIFGSLAIRAMNAGLSKGLYSNEAGMGSSPLFNATVKGDKSIKEESIISSTSVFIDTVVLCSITGLILVASGLTGTIENPITLTNAVFGMIPYGKYMLSFSLAIFAIATIPCWGYYGSIGIRYLFHGKNFYPFVYKVVYGSCVFIGALATVQTVWSISSIANALMIFPNLYMIYALRKEVE